MLTDMKLLTKTTPHTRAVDLFIVGVCAAMQMSLLFTSWAFADLPPLIRYQGEAVDSQGVSLEGPYTLTFRLYDAQTGGTTVWEETQPSVPLAGGYFSVLLGQVTPLSVDWSQPLWLSVQVNTDPELAPRQQITSVPLAMVADRLAVPPATSNITDDTNRLVPSGAIILWDGASCPMGYQRISALDGKFLVSGTSFNPAAGGSNTHTHSASGSTDTDGAHRHGIVQISMSNRMFGNDNDDDTFQPSESGSSHSHHFSSTTNPADHRPEFATVLLCKKD